MSKSDIIKKTTSKQEKLQNALLIARSLIDNLQYERSRFQRNFGRSYLNDTGDYKRDLYQALGYPDNIQFSHYLKAYRRQDIAKRIVNAPASDSWKNKPEIVSVNSENNKRDTLFEKTWDELEKKLHVLHYLTRIDKMSGVGQYGVLLLGFDDVANPEDMQNEVEQKKGRKLLHLTPYFQDQAKIDTLDEDPVSPRYMLPETYKLTINQTLSKKSRGLTELKVHHSRILHVAEGCMEDNIYGTPRLEIVWNRLLNLETIVGGGAEGYCSLYQF